MKKTVLTSLGILILRVGLSATMMTHGFKKAKMLFGDGDIKFPDPIGIGEVFSLTLATVAELLFAALVLIGYKTRLSSIPVAFTMFVAFFFIHIDDPWKKQELSVVYLIGFVAIALIGGGKYSIDGILKKN
jgi:putative oxidoreductase